MLSVLVAALIFTEAECAEIRAAMAVMDPVQVVHAAVLNKWHMMNRELTPGEIAEALRLECKVFVPVAQE